MANIAGKILNTRFDLVGFVLSDGINMIPYSIEKLRSMPELTSNIAFTADGFIVEQGNFKIKDTDSFILTQTNEIKPCKLEIEFIARLILNGELVGFRVKLLNNIYNVRTEDIINKMVIINCPKFTLRNLNGKQYIAGKPGYSVEELAEINMTPDVKGKANQSTSIDRGASKRAYSEEITKNFDMVSIVDILRDLNGQLLYLPEQKYNRITDEAVNRDSRFISLGVEVASPYIVYYEKSTNTNIKFNKIGYVSIDIDKGTTKQYCCFENKVKTVFRLGEINTHLLGVIIRKDKLKEFAERLGETLSFAEITDKVTNEYIKRYLGLSENEYDYYSLLTFDIRNLSPITKEHAKEYRLGLYDVANRVENLLNLKSANSYLRSVLADFNGIYPENRESTIWTPYRGYNDLELELLEQAGVDITSGRFRDKNTQEKIETDKGAEKLETVQVEFKLAGMTPHPSAIQIIKDRAKALAKFTKAAQIIDVIDNICKSNDVEQVRKELKQLEYKIKLEILKIKTDIWKHNVSCLTLGNYSVYKTDGETTWEPVKTLKSGTVWKPASSDNITMVISDTSMKVE